MGAGPFVAFLFDARLGLLFGSDRVQLNYDNLRGVPFFFPLARGESVLALLRLPVTPRVFVLSFSDLP